MKASVDASSLIFLLKIPELFNLASTYFEKIYVTDDVYNEVFYAKFSDEIADMERVKARFERKNPKKILQTKLGKGELSSISLAYEENVLFVSEDKKGIAFASSIGVKFTSLLSILIKAREGKKLNKEEAKELLFKLVGDGFYISSELLSLMIKKLES